jgi:transcriptional regulator with XRE-family HTH domain
MRGTNHSTGTAAEVSQLGALLRQWRATRRMSQLDLSLEADISSRHLSYVESGKAQPSREMVTRLADALNVPLRERNSLLIAAGFAPIYRQTGLSAPEMALTKRAMELLLKQQEPYPAIVLDRHWNLLQGNEGAAKFLQFTLGRIPQERNIARQLLRDEYLKPFIANWDEMARDIIRRLHQEVAWVPTDEALRALLAEVLLYPGVPETWRARELEVPASPLLNFVVRKGNVELRFFSTWTTFGSPHDVTLEELRIESSFPADEATEKAWAEVLAELKAQRR